MSPTCQAMVHDLRRLARGPLAGGLEECWRQCGYQAAQVWTDPLEADEPERLVCRAHARELDQLAVQGLTGQVRWTKRIWAPETVKTVAAQDVAPVPLPPPVAGDGSAQLPLLGGAL